MMNNDRLALAGLNIVQRPQDNVGSWNQVCLIKLMVFRSVR
jgi:hypothetical protein